MENKVILYHTSYCVVNEPNLELCNINGQYGEIGSEEADSLCLHFLIPNKFEDQCVFRSESAISHLKFLGSDEVCLL